MATYTVPTVNGVTLPDPSDSDIKVEYRGGRQILADGTLVTDLADTNAKRIIKLEWDLTPDISNIVIAFQDLKNTSQALTYIDGSSYTVTIDPQSPDLTYKIIAAAGKILWYKNVRLSMREV